jgi:hypothetical protein
MVDYSKENKDIVRLIAAAAQFHGIDVPVLAYREEGNDVIITVLGGRELKCKVHDLYSGETKQRPSEAKPRVSGAKPAAGGAEAKPDKESASIAKPPRKTPRSGVKGK